MNEILISQPKEILIPESFEKKEFARRWTTKLGLKGKPISERRYQIITNYKLHLRNKYDLFIDDLSGFVYYNYKPYIKMKNKHKTRKFFINFIIYGNPCYTYIQMCKDRGYSNPETQAQYDNKRKQFHRLKKSISSDLQKLIEPEPGKGYKLKDEIKLKYFIISNNLKY
jgi:hypothetical protein